ncbi:MAG: hypothetical protein JWP15_3507 [Alphaproteobacteria bacterium]|nr:hypothetical protein [Alphaproteobacteria bacterium]
MKKLVAFVAIEVVAMACVGIWLTIGTAREAGPNAFTALSYVFDFTRH